MNAKHDNLKDSPKPAAKSDKDAQASARIRDLLAGEASMGLFSMTAGVGDVGVASVAPLLVPFAKVTRERGRIFRRGVVERLQIGASICVTGAYSLMRERGASAVEAEERIGKLSPISWDYAGRIANKYLRDTDLPAMAIDSLIAALSGDRLDPRDGLVEAAHLCGVGLNRAARITATTEEASRYELYDAADRLFDAYYSPQNDLPLRDVIVVSACSGMRGHVLWPQYTPVAKLIDVAVFAAKLILDSHRPAAVQRADLHPTLFPLVSAFLDAIAQGCSLEWTDDAVKLVLRLMRAVGRNAELRAAITAATGAGKSLVIGKGEYWRSNAAREFDRPEDLDVTRGKRGARR
jgi:hypothetical protein